jgi:hypothetical protein
VRWVGYWGTLQFNGVLAGSAGPASVTIWYVNGDRTRRACLRAAGGPGVCVDFPTTGSWANVGSVTVIVPLGAGANSLTVSNAAGWTPDLDKISVRVPAG